MNFPRLLITAFLSCALLAHASEPVKHVQAVEASKIIAEGKTAVIDVRTAEEFAEGHIQGAKNIDVFASDFKAQLGKQDKKQPVLVHCQSGGRSTNSLEVFQKLGFEKIIHLDGGFSGWKKAGLPVQK